VPLLETADGVDEVISNSSQLGHYDYWCYAQSAPLYLNTTLDSIPAKLPYLRALPQRVASWQPRIPARGLRVGLVWKGSSNFEFNEPRSLPGLNTLTPLWRVDGVSFVSLQKGLGEDEPNEPGAPAPLVALGKDIHDFADTAAIVESLDLVITTCTSIAHVAGALGKTCWVMLASPWADWRWLTDRSDSPWYPGVIRLFRQQRAGDWDEVIGRVAVALKEKVEAVAQSH
jgi:hypothetical protein